MTPPDLDSPEGLAAYRAELRRVARVPRFAGFAAVFVGGTLVLAASQRLLGLTPDASLYGYGLLAIGWLLVVVAFLLRSRYHRARMSQIPESRP